MNIMNSHCASEVLCVDKPNLPAVKILSNDEDEVNIAQFHPNAGYGLLYGTKRGKVKVFRRHAGSVDEI